MLVQGPVDGVRSEVATDMQRVHAVGSLLEGVGSDRHDAVLVPNLGRRPHEGEDVLALDGHRLLPEDLVKGSLGLPACLPSASDAEGDPSVDHVVAEDVVDEHLDLVGQLVLEHRTELSSFSLGQADPRPKGAPPLDVDHLGLEGGRGSARCRPACLVHRGAPTANSRRSGRDVFVLDLVHALVHLSHTVLELRVHVVQGLRLRLLGGLLVRVVEGLLLLLLVDVHLLLQGPLLQDELLLQLGVDVVHLLEELPLPHRELSRHHHDVGLDPRGSRWSKVRSAIPSGNQSGSAIDLHGGVPPNSRAAASALSLVSESISSASGPSSSSSSS